MPKIKAYTPAWLSGSSPGHQLFAPNPDDARNIPSYASLAVSAAGPRRTIARRGTEVFIAVGKEIRWADLVYLKERWQEKEAQGRQRVRIKREDSDEESDEVEDSDVIKDSIENGCAEGFRVSISSQPVTSTSTQTNSFVDNQTCCDRKRYSAARHVALC
jgi:nucleoporin NUP82